MAYGRGKVIPPPATPFEEFMATASDRMTAARLEFVEALREMPPAASKIEHAIDATPSPTQVHARHGRQGQEGLVGLVRDQG